MEILKKIQVQKNWKKSPSQSAIGNLNSLPAHNFSKLTRLKAFISMYKHDFICLWETYLDISVPDSLLEIDGHTLVYADHRNDTKRHGVCIYYKESLGIRVINLS